MANITWALRPTIMVESFGVSGKLVTKITKPEKFEYLFLVASSSLEMIAKITWALKEEG